MWSLLLVVSVVLMFRLGAGYITGYITGAIENINEHKDTKMKMQKEIDSLITQNKEMDDELSKIKNS